MMYRNKVDGTLYSDGTTGEVNCIVWNMVRVMIFGSEDKFNDFSSGADSSRLRSRVLDCHLLR